MIPGITEVNFPSYATMDNATVSLAEMGDRVITTQLHIDGDVVPEYGVWDNGAFLPMTLKFRGEPFILPIREPQASKDNTTLNSISELTFYSWATYQMKRYFFFQVTTRATGIIVADKYKASVSLEIGPFCDMLNSVLEYYLGPDKIVVDLNSGTTSDPAFIEISYSYIWDVLQKVYDAYGLRWYIEYDEENDKFIIKVGYPAKSIYDHDFEYGFEGGLIRFERQVQDANVNNVLLGRGGTQNLPYRYFKKTDPQNPSFPADPDAIPELSNVYFERLLDANFRWYVRGWVKNESRDTSQDDGYTLPDYDEEDVPLEYLWSYYKGRYTDTVFNPVEFVRDADSIAKYGERWGALDDNDDIYPTIQDRYWGDTRVDTVLDVSPILTDDREQAAAEAAEKINVEGVLNQTDTIPANTTVTKIVEGGTFTVPEDRTADLLDNGFFVSANVPRRQAMAIAKTDACRVLVYDSNGNEVVREGLTEGTYTYKLRCVIQNNNRGSVDATYGVNGLYLLLSGETGDSWKPTFDIWVRNIFDTHREAGETDDDYSLRVWQSILGDHLGNEAKVVFSDGPMSMSEDYEFKIASYPVFDDSKTFIDSTKSGGTQAVQSEWRITLWKSDAELDATGLYIPAASGAKPVAGNHIFFVGIDMPNIYVTMAEDALTEYKTTALSNLKEINPTWVVQLDKVRIDQEYNEEYERLIDKLETGTKVNVKDPRFTGGNVLSLFLQSVTFTWANDTVILPSVDVVLTDKVSPVMSPVAQLQSQIDVVRATYAQTASVEEIARSVTKPMYLAKTGEEQLSQSPTKFASMLSSDDFEQGGFGGQGWGFYRDTTEDLKQDIAEAEEMNTMSLMRSAPVASQLRSGEDSETDSGDTAARSGSQAVLEIDRLIVRHEMMVNSLVVNQIAYVGGKQIISAAAIECVQVVEDSDGYRCYFDQKQGSVKNLFVVNDVAMGQVFSAEGLELRFYKRLVTEVGIDYIKLSKTQKYGTGIPQKGDVIVQYGNTQYEDRRYVIIRDVIGGGYEQMLSNLNSVSASGIEYYFAGMNARAQGGTLPLRDSNENQLVDDDGLDLHVLGGARPRFFVGDPDSKLEYSARDKTVRVKGVISQSPSGVEFPITTFREDGDYSPDKWYYYGDLVVYNGEGWVHIGKERTKGTAPTTGNVWRLYTARGEAYYRIDLTNENAMINADASGNILPGAVRPTSTASLFYGTGAVPNPTYSISVPQAQNVRGVSINSSTGVLTFNAGTHTTPFNFDGTSLRITVTGTATVNGQSVTASEDMIVTKAIPGAEGKPATSYWLVLTSDKVAVNPNTNPETIQPADVTPTAMLQVGEEAPRPADAADNLSITYQYDSETEAALPESGKVTIATKNASQQRRYNLHFYLKKTVDNVETVVDQESVPILYDGVNGENALVADLSNETDGIAVGSDGILTASPTPLVTKVHMYLGDQAQSISSATPDFASSNVPSAWISGHKLTYAVTGINTTEATITFTITASTSAPLDFSSISVLEIPIQITCAKGTRTLTYSLLPVKEGEDGTVFKLVPSADVIKGTRGSDGTTISYSPNNISCSRTAHKGDDDLSASTYGYLRMSVNGGVSEKAYAAISSSDQDPTDWNAMISAGKIIYYWYSDSSYTHLIDRETVPVVVDGQKGGQGTQGKIMRGVNVYDATYGAGVSTSTLVEYQGLSDPYNASTGNIYYDVVYREVNNVKTYFYCDHGMDEDGVTPARQVAPNPSSDSYCWKRASNFDFIATRVFLAQNAHIDFLSGQDIYVKNGDAVVAGMLGGTGINFFAGGTKAQAEAGTAPFRVTNTGKVYATDVELEGAVYAKGYNFSDGQQGSQNEFSIKSQYGLFVAEGRALFGGNISMPDGQLLAISSTTQNAQHHLEASYGQNVGDLLLSAQTGTAKLKAQDSSHSVELSLYGGEATLKRGSGSFENIITSPDFNRIVKVSQLPQSPDANTMYLVELNQQQS